MIFEHNDYRTYLKAVLADRLSRNPAYSLRAFAKALGVSSSGLCEVLKGKSGWSVDVASTVAKKLDLEGLESEYFCLLVQYSATKNLDLKSTFLARINAINPVNTTENLSLDFFRVISDWYHLAILELTECESFRNDMVWIAAQLGITILEADVAIERLLRLEMLEMTSENKLKKTKVNFVAKSSVPEKSIRHFYQQLLRKTSEAVETLTPQEKTSGVEMFAFNKSALPDARKIIEKCFQDMLALSQSTPQKDEVYQIGIHMFPLNKPQNLKSKLQSRKKRTNHEKN